MPQSTTPTSPGASAGRRRGPRRATLAGIALLAAAPLVLTACSNSPHGKVAIVTSEAAQPSLGSAASTQGAPSATKDPTGATSSVTPTGSGSGASAATTGYAGCSAPTPDKWGDPVSSNSFNSTTSSPDGWNVYSSTTGTLRARSQVRESGGNLKLTGTTIGGKSVSGGVSDEFSQKYGRWEACMKADRGQGYYPAIVLWPDDNDWPVGGEIDLIESVDGNRMRNIHFVHNNAGNDRKGIKFYLDITQWHEYAVDWLPHSVVFSVDGVEQWTMTDQNLVPSRDKMHMTLQFDAVNAPSCRDGCRNAETPKHPVMSINWVKAYRYTKQKD